VEKFRFEFDIDNATHTCRIELVSGPCIEDGVRGWNHPDYGDLCEKLDKEIKDRRLEHVFGVHDFSADESDNLIGYDTYEVDTLKRAEELVAIWKEILVAAGFKLGAEKWTGRAWSPDPYWNDPDPR